MTWRWNSEKFKTFWRKKTSQFFVIDVHLGYSFSTHYNALMVNSTLKKVIVAIKDHHPLMGFDVSYHSLYIVLHYIYWFLVHVDMYTITIIVKMTFIKWL